MKRREYHHSLHNIVERKIMCDLGDDYGIEGEYQFFKVVGFPVRVATVDGFQGEENDIIILSMVRSKIRVTLVSSSKRIVFALLFLALKRPCFVFGNFEPMSDGNREWRKIIDYAKRIGAFVNKIPLKSHHSFDLFDTTSAQE